MGMKLVGLALTKWAPHVPDRAFRVLLRMAATALDEPTDKYPAATFFGGKDVLLSVMRAERHGTMASMEKALGRAIADLVELGAVERLNKPRAGTRGEYRLTLFGAIHIDGRAVDNPVEKQIQPDTHGGAQPDTSGPQPDTHRGAQPDTSGYLSPTPTGGPRNKEEELQEELEEQPQKNAADLVEPVTVRARDDEPPEKSEIEPRCRNPECLNGSVIDKTKPKGKRIAPCPECQPPNNVIQFGRRTA